MHETTWSGAATGVYTDAYTRVIEPGCMKIVIENDWTSYEVISCDIKITVAAAKAPSPDVKICMHSISKKQRSSRQFCV